MAHDEPGLDRPSRPRRKPWVWLFVLGGLPAFGSLAALLFDPAAALPWAILLVPPVAYAGYRIWRIDHPTGRARHEIGWRLASVASYTVALGITGVLVAAPGAVLLVGGILIVFLVVLLVAFFAYSAHLQRSIARGGTPIAGVPDQTGPPEP